MATVPTPLIRTKTRGQQQMEHRLGEPLDVVLRRLYVTEGLDQKAIAGLWGLEQSTVSRWLRDFGISRFDRT